MGVIARHLASAISMACKVDFFRKSKNNEVGRGLNKKLHKLVDQFKAKSDKKTSKRYNNNKEEAKFQKDFEAKKTRRFSRRRAK